MRYIVNTGLEVYPDIFDRTKTDIAPLHAEANNGRLECVKIMVESGGVSVDGRDKFGRTPLLASAHGCKAEIVRYLLGQGADPTARLNAELEITKEFFGEYAGADALELAVTHGSIEAIRMILEHPLYGSTRKRKNREGENPSVWVTPLAIKGAAGANFEALKLLLERGAYPLEDQDGKTKAELLDEEQRQAIIDATQAAAETGDLESPILLLSYQYHIDGNGNILPFELPDSLHKVLTYGTYNAIVKNYIEKFEFLRTFGVKEHDTMSLDELPEGQLVNVQNLLEKGAQAGAVDGVRHVIDNYGADPNAHRIPIGVKPLYLAAANNKIEVVKIHVGNGRYASGPTALWIAISLKSLDSIALLLLHGGPVDYIDEEILNLKEPTTAILQAIFGKLPERPTVRFELESNAQQYIERATIDFMNMNPPYVRLEIGPEDKEWIAKLQLRKSNNELKETEKNARELNREEGTKFKDREESDARRLMVSYPTINDREAALRNDDDLIPKFEPAFGPAEQDSE